MRIYGIFFSILVLSILGNLKSAQASIGIINIRLLMEQAPQAIVIKQVVENDFKSRQQRLRSLQKKIDEKTAKFLKEKEFMSKEKKNKSNLALQNMKEGMNALEREFQTDYVIRQREATDKFFKVVRDEIKALSKERKILIVMKNESVFWANNSLDITEQILSLLNKKETDKK